jgi:hypothetical protein
MNEDLRQEIKTEALKEGGSVRSICRHLREGGIKIGRSRINMEMTGNYRDALEALVEYKKARTVCFLTEQMMIDRYNFAVMWTRVRFYGSTGGMCAKPEQRSAKFLNMIKDWLFSNEKSFHTFGSNAKRPPKWVEIGDIYHVPCYKNASTKFHVFGGVSWWGNSTPVRASGVHVTVVHQYCSTPVRASGIHVL